MEQGLSVWCGVCGVVCVVWCVWCVWCGVVCVVWCVWCGVVCVCVGGGGGGGGGGGESLPCTFTKALIVVDISSNTFPASSDMYQYIHTPQTLRAPWPCHTHCHPGRENDELTYCNVLLELEDFSCGSVVPTEVR